MSDAPLYAMLKINATTILVGRFLSETEHEVVMAYPLSLEIYSDDDTVKVMTSKFFPFAVNNEVAIQKESIVATATPKQNLVQYYLDFIAKYQDLMDNKLEDSVLGIRSNDSKEFQEVQKSPTGLTH